MTVQAQIWRPELDKEKYKQTILFLLNGPANNPLLGKLKLFKLLYYIDFDHFEFYRSAITGDTYRKEAHGPFPNHGDEILREMVAEQLISMSLVPVGNYSRFDFTALAPANKEAFSRSEMEILEQVVLKWANHTREEIENATHGEAPWRAVQMREEMPYTLAFYRHQQADDDDLDANASIERPTIFSTFR